MTEQEKKPTDIVGHITYEDGPMRFRHEPLTREVGDALLAAADAAKKRRTEAMPDEQSAIHQLWDAFQRLRELGWSETAYAPKGPRLQLIECGSTGIHEGFRDEHGLWIQDDDTWPTRAVLYRLVLALSDQRASVEGKK